MEKSIMRENERWRWTESLGGVRPDRDQTLRVRRILFGLVRDRCYDLGIREGQELRCRSRTPHEVHLELEGGGVRSLDLAYAWFVGVAPVTDPPATDGEVPH